MKAFSFSIFFLFFVASELDAQLVKIDEEKKICDPPSVKEPALRDELLALRDEDQDARNKLVSALNASKSKNATNGSFLLTGDAAEAIKLVSSIDKKSRERMKQIVAKHGWPGRSLVGEEAAHAAWLLVQHADADLEHQRCCLDLMKSAPTGEVASTDIAYLTDRILVAEGKEQLYGTQLDSNFDPKPIFEPNKVDQRRASIGLSPLAEYIEHTKVHYLGTNTKSDNTDNPSK